jgi:RNA polymerase sigma factor (TIGR02999 family)
MPSYPTPPPRTGGTGDPDDDDISAGEATPGRTDPAALDRRYDQLYDELRVLARRHLRNARDGHTLDTVGLVHESYLKLASLQGGQWHSRAQFFALASVTMRHILVDYARARRAGKRGGGSLQVTLRPEHPAADRPIVDLLALDEALTRLGRHSERMERIVEYRFFGGLSMAETAEALETSVRTVEREWTRARTYLYRLLAPDGG